MLLGVSSTNNVYRFRAYQMTYKNAIRLVTSEDLCEHVRIVQLKVFTVNSEEAENVHTAEIVCAHAQKGKKMFGTSDRGRANEN